jgi:hypothetical protein
MDKLKRKLRIEKVISIVVVRQCGYSGKPIDKILLIIPGIYIILGRIGNNISLYVIIIIPLSIWIKLMNSK